MRAIFYDFAKRVNSTARPQNGRAFDIVFKYPSSIHSPVLQIKASEFNYNYCYIEQFQAYYKITDARTIANGLWEVSLEHDLLATYRDDILGNSAYIDYAEFNYNPMIPDLRCARYDIKVNKRVLSIPKMQFLSTGGYILSVLSQQNRGNNFATYYYLSSAELNQLTNMFMNPDYDWSGLIDILERPFDFIISLSWTPFAPEVIPGSWAVTTVHVGNKDLGVSAWLVGADFTIDGSIEQFIPWVYNDFRKLEPYTNLKMYCPLYGIVDLPSAAFVNDATMTIKYSLDATTGDLTLQFGRTAGERFFVISSINYNVNVSLPVAKFTANVTDRVESTLGLAAGVVGTGMALASGNALGVLGGVTSAVSSAINLGSASANFSASVKGSAQGRSMKDLPLDFELYAYTYDTENPDLYAQIKGRPICEYAPLSEYQGGFVQAHSSLVINDALPTEVDRLNSMLSDGIYLE